jgi:membrane protein implicated in regulation of membrane protease activity
MQWAFLVLAVLAALVELHTGTFYLAAVAAAAVLTALTGIWARDDLLILVFLLLCAMLTAAVMLSRRSWTHTKALVDFDIGQSVSITGIAPHGRHLIVSYRGADWQAVMEDGSVLTPGDTAIITRKTDKLLHLALPPAMAAREQSA